MDICCAAVEGQEMHAGGGADRRHPHLHRGLRGFGRDGGADIGRYRVGLGVGTGQDMKWYMLDEIVYAR